MRLRSGGFLLLSTLIMLNQGCGGDSSTAPQGGDNKPSIPSPVPTSLVLSPSTFRIDGFGNTQRLSAAIMDQNGNVMTGQQVAWTSSDTLVARVDGTGLVTGLSQGNASIKATSGSLTGSVSGDVFPEVVVVLVSPTQIFIDSVAGAAQLRARLLDKTGAWVDVLTPESWSSSDAAVATVDEDGRVTAQGPGVVSVTATYKGVSGSAEIQVPSGQASTIMSTSGGVLLSRDGLLTLDVPPNALGGPTTITVEPAATHPTDDLLLPGSVYEFGPPGTEFQRPAIIEFDYDPSVIPDGQSPSSLGIYLVTGGGWEEMASVEVDTVNHNVRAEIDHFSQYGVRAGRVGNLSGTWAIEETYLQDGCFDETGASFSSIIQVTQTESSLSVESEGQTYSGTISGNAFNYAGTVSIDGYTVNLTVVAGLEFGNQTTEGTAHYAYQNDDGICEIRSSFSGRQVPDGSVDGNVPVNSLVLVVDDLPGPSVEVDGNAQQYVRIRVDAFDVDGRSINEPWEITVNSTEPRVVGKFSNEPGDEASIPLGLSGTTTLTASVLTERGGIPVVVSSDPVQVVVTRGVKKIRPLTVFTVVQEPTIWFREYSGEAVAWYIGSGTDDQGRPPVHSMGSGIEEPKDRSRAYKISHGLGADSCGWSEEVPGTRKCNIHVGSLLFAQEWANWKRGIDDSAPLSYYIEGRNAQGTVVSRTEMAELLVLPSTITINVSGSRSIQRSSKSLIGLDNGFVGAIMTYQRSHLGGEDRVAFYAGDNYWPVAGDPDYVRADREDDVRLQGVFPGTLEGDSTYLNSGQYICGPDDFPFLLSWGDGAGTVFNFQSPGNNDPCFGDFTIDDDWQAVEDKLNDVTYVFLTVRISGDAIEEPRPGETPGLAAVSIYAKIVLPKVDYWLAPPGETIEEFLRARPWWIGEGR